MGGEVAHRARDRGLRVGEAAARRRHHHRERVVDGRHELQRVDLAAPTTVWAMRALPFSCGPHAQERISPSAIIRYSRPKASIRAAVAAGRVRGIEAEAAQEGRARRAGSRRDAVGGSGAGARRCAAVAPAGRALAAGPSRSSRARAADAARRRRRRADPVEVAGGAGATSKRRAAQADARGQDARGVGAAGRG